eukprot:2799860-Pleurochrysis_carterae.AAC.1
MTQPTKAFAGRTCHPLKLHVRVMGGVFAKAVSPCKAFCRCQLGSPPHHCTTPVCPCRIGDKSFVS